MKKVKRNVAALLAGLIAGSCWACVSRADEPARPPEAGSITIVDAAGKEHKLKTWKFTAGTRHLTWLAPAAPRSDDKPPKPGDQAKPPAGPEALELREENSTTLKDGILTLVPLDRIRAIDFDAEKETVSVRVATTAKAEGDVVLTGSTAFVGVNKFAIESEVDKGEMGVAVVAYKGGEGAGIRGIRFAEPRVAPAAPAARPAVVTGADKDKSEHKVSELQPLYEMPDGSRRLLTTLPFKKTLKVDIGKVQKIRAASRSGEGAEWEVTLKDGDSNTLILLKSLTVDGKQAVLVGLVGRAPTGYRLFSIPAIAAVQFDDKKE